MQAVGLDFACQTVLGDLRKKRRRFGVMIGKSNKFIAHPLWAAAGIVIGISVGAASALAGEQVAFFQDSDKGKTVQSDELAKIRGAGLTPDATTSQSQIKVAVTLWDEFKPSSTTNGVHNTGSVSVTINGVPGSTGR